MIEIVVDEINSNRCLLFVQVDPKKAAPQGKVRNYVESLYDYEYIDLVHVVYRF